MEGQYFTIDYAVHFPEAENLTGIKKNKTGLFDQRTQGKKLQACLAVC